MFTFVDRGGHRYHPVAVLLIGWTILLMLLLAACGGDQGVGSGADRQDSAAPTTVTDRDGTTPNPVSIMPTERLSGQGSGGRTGSGCGSGKFPDADEIQEGQTVEGSIGIDGWDEYCFQAEDGGTYLFEAVSGTLTLPALQVGIDKYMEGPNELASGHEIAVFEAPSPDTYLLVISGGFGYSGTYAVRMSRVEDDHPNTFTNPTVAGEGQTIAGEIGYRADVDSFRVEVERGRIYRVQMDSRGNENISWNVTGSTPDPDITRFGDGFFQYTEVYSNSYYHVRVLGGTDDAGERATGSYSLTFSSYLPGEDDHGESAEQATNINAGEATPGKIEYRGDRDFFRFQAEPRITYRFDVQFHGLEELEVHDLSGEAERRLTVEELAGRAEIALHDGSGEEVGRSWGLDLEAIEAELERILLWATPVAGPYHVSVEFDYHLPYDLTLTVIPDQPDQPEGAPEIKTGQSLDGSVGQGDVDYFRVHLVEGQEYVLYTFGSDFSHVWEFSTELFDDSGDALSEDDERGTVTAAKTGTYFLRVSNSWAGAAVPYRVYLTAYD